jgi:hypothetical protein
MANYTTEQEEILEAYEDGLLTRGETRDQLIMAGLTDSEASTALDEIDGEDDDED